MPSADGLLGALARTACPMPSADGLLNAFARTAGPTPIINLSHLALSKLEEARSTPYKLYQLKCNILFFVLERGPPVSVRDALKRFESTELDTVADAVLLAQRFGITLPDE